MKIVENENNLSELFSLAKNEAKKYFGNDDLYIEKYFKNPRHIEVQVMSGKQNSSIRRKGLHSAKKTSKINRRNSKSSSYG